MAAGNFILTQIISGRSLTEKPRYLESDCRLNCDICMCSEAGAAVPVLGGTGAVKLRGSDGSGPTLKLNIKSVVEDPKDCFSDTDRQKLY
jgi:hypothetical protein